MTTSDHSSEGVWEEDKQGNTQKTMPFPLVSNVS